MIQIQNTLISDDIFEEQFICNLCKCKGQCCVEGESGAPLTREEFEQIKEILPDIRDELSAKAIELINDQGIAYIDNDGELVTSIIEGKECVLPISMRMAYASAQLTKHTERGGFQFKNQYLAIYTLSGLMSIIILQLSITSGGISASPHLILDKKRGDTSLPVLKEPLIRRFGEDWYNELCKAAELFKENC